MSNTVKTRISRRDVLKGTGALSAMGVAATVTAPMMAQQQIQTPFALKHMGDNASNLYTQIGVRPIINGRGTFTLISGSRSLPEVKQAMYDASFYFVHLDELQHAVGAELGKLNGCEWGVATTGCEAAIALSVVACVCGTDPEKSQAFPYRMAKDQVIIPKHSRNPYDFGVRMTGVEVIEIETAEELKNKISARTAMIYIMSSPLTEKGELSIANICTIAKESDVPVFVDAAAEEPQNPNKHIVAGASLVGYSGGKCMRGPQSAGMLIGKKDLCMAAYFQAAPHHNYGRAYKCSKEEIMGLLAAVRAWYERDHDAEQRTWRSWLQTIESKLKGLPSTSFEYLEPDDLSNKSPRLRISWDANVLKITGTEMEAELDKGTPRILIDGGRGVRPDNMKSSIAIMPYMMDAGEDVVIADAVYKLLTKPPAFANPVVPEGAADVAGNWLASLEFGRGASEQHFHLSVSGNDVTGTQTGDYYDAKLKGSIHGNQLVVASDMKVSGHSVGWSFTGTVQGNTMSGTVGLGEYGSAKWSAVRV